MSVYKNSLIGETKNVVASGTDEAAPGLVVKHIFARASYRSQVHQLDSESYKEHLEINATWSRFRKESQALSDALGITVDGKPAPDIIIEEHSRDVRVRRRVSIERKKGGGVRKEITMLSRQARQRMYFTARNIDGLTHMITLTYPAEYPHDGEVVKYHWKLFRQFLTRNGFDYGFWFLEFQRRGAPHFHVFLPAVKKERDERWLHTVSYRWAEIVDSSDFSKHVRAGTRFEKLRREGAVGGYVYKYALKSEQKEVPENYRNVGRFWGVWGEQAKTIKNTFAGVADEGNLLLLSRLIRRDQNAQLRRDGKRVKKYKGRVGFTGWNGARVLNTIRKWFAENKDVPRLTSGYEYKGRRYGGMAVPLGQLPDAKRNSS